MVRKNLFEKVRGFDETIKIYEDNDFAYRASKNGKFGVLRNVHVYYSARRFYKDGFYKVINKHLQIEFYRLMNRRIPNYRLEDYKFGNHDKAFAEYEKKLFKMV